MKRTDKVEKRESDNALFARKDQGTFNKQCGGSERHGSGKFSPMGKEIETDSQGPIMSNRILPQNIRV